MRSSISRPRYLALDLALIVEANQSWYFGALPVEDDVHDADDFRHPERCGGADHAAHPWRRDAAARPAEGLRTLRRDRAAGDHECLDRQDGAAGAGGRPGDPGQIGRGPGADRRLRHATVRPRHRHGHGRGDLLRPRPERLLHELVGPQGGEGFEYHLLAIGLALALLVHGAGKWSFDQRIAR